MLPLIHPGVIATVHKESSGSSNSVASRPGKGFKIGGRKPLPLVMPKVLFSN